MEGYVFPNEVHVLWGLAIVVYPYITGLVAGAFIVSSLYHVFNIRTLKPVSRFSLLTALAFLLICPFPLLLHLGRPERNYEIFLTPNPTSAMAGFGYIWALYTLLVLTENWVSFRGDLIRKRAESQGLYRLLLRVITLDSDLNADTVEADHRVVTLLAAVGIPMACILHGYVGFLFGGVKANPWWETALMPLIFLMSAIVSGIALLLVLYLLSCKLRGTPVDVECLQSLSGWLMGFLIIDFTIEALEIVSMYYKWEESMDVIAHLLVNKLRQTFFYLQIGLGTLVPLAGLVLARRIRSNPGLKVAACVLSSLCVLAGVLSMRFNVVIGGQLFSKSMRGFIHFDVPWLGREGLLTMLAVLSIPFVILSVLCWFVPPWAEPAEPAMQPGSHGRH